MREGTAALADVEPHPVGDGPVSLAERFVRGEAGAFDELVALHQPRVTRLVHRLLGWRGARSDVDDVVQEVFLAALKAGPRFRGQASLATWLTTITLNQCRSHQRRRRFASLFLARRDHGNDSEPPASRPPVGHGLTGAETSARVRSAVQALPPRDREVVVLRYFESMTPAEIGTATGQSKNAVEVRLHRARARLAEALRDVSEEDQKP